MHWPPQLTLAVAIGLQLLLPSRLTVGPRWMLPALEAILLGVLIIVSPLRVEGPHAVRRRLAVTLAMLASAANTISLVLLCHFLLNHNVPSGHQLIIAGVLIWLTNVIVFSLWYWELDRGGPGTRAAGEDELPDMLFPQMTSDDRFAPGWRPQFADYLYTSLTNATAFSPTDTLPLTIVAKLAMGLQSVVSLVTLGLVISRAVNIL
jgi:uncharacterized membrane protein